MRIGLITDTHVPWVDRDLPQEVFDVFKGVDLILHAGDIYSHVVLDRLERVAPVLAALGDDDYPTSDERVKEKHVLKIEGKTIWLVHEGPYFPVNSVWLSTWLKNRCSPEEVVEKPDIIVSGHEHRTFLKRNDGLMHVNSGSATYLGYQRGLGTVGILDLIAGAPSRVRLMHLESVDTPLVEDVF